MTGPAPGAPARPTLVRPWAWTYALVSPVVAVVSLYWSVGSTSGGGDFCDPIYTSAAERDADFRTATWGIAVPSLLMLVVGAVLLVVIARNRGRLAARVLAFVAMALVMAGWVWVLTLADFSADCG